MEKGRRCGDCRFCCWSFAVHDIPDEIKGVEDKPILKHCKYECSTGCLIHEQINYPPACKGFICPYLSGENIYRPNTFQPLLEELNKNIGNHIPSISPKIPIKKAERLIRKTKAIPVSITIGGEWIRVVISFNPDQNKDGDCIATKEITEQWKKLHQKYDCNIRSIS